MDTLVAPHAGHKAHAPAALAPSPRAPVAAWRHTAILTAIFLALAALGAMFQRGAVAAGGGAARQSSQAPLYLSLLAAEWGLVYYAMVGVRRTGTTLRDLIGGRWRSARDVLTDVALAAAIWGAWSLVAIAWGRVSGPSHARSITTLLPHGAIETLLWVALSISAGFAEELIFRGYFQRQFEALTRRAWMALVMQALLFGVSHGYQGVEACAKITVYAMLFGMVAIWRRSLRPGMLAHAWTDIAAGVLGI